MSYIHFIERERYVISHMKMAGFSLRAIGRRLGRHHTSIMREINRNRPTYARFKELGLLNDLRGTRTKQNKEAIREESLRRAREE